jgi:hypothetical protein
MYRYFIAAGAPGSLAQGVFVNVGLRASSAPALEGWAVASAREPTSRETVSQARIVGCRSHGRAGCFQEQLGVAFDLARLFWASGSSLPEKSSSRTT